MSVARRRVLLYWLLLILPALAVGAGAAWMMQRERIRIADQAMKTAESRQEAVRERARLTMEGIEALLADVQNSLAVSLRETPLGFEQNYLEELRESNALVSDVFGADVHGDLEWGGNDDSISAWLSNRPWNTEPRARVVELEDTRLQYDVPQGDFEVVANRAFVEQTNARSMLQQEAARKSVRSDAVAARSAEEQRQRRGGEVREQLESRVVTWTTDGEGRSVTVIAWMSTGRGLYVGLVLETVGLIDRIQATLPQDLAQGENFVLIATEEADTEYRWTRSAPDTLLVEIPLSSALLPGWQVAGFLLAENWQLSSSPVGFILSMILVALLVVAIIAGGSLLMREARRSEKEAAQRVSFVSHVSHEFKTPLTTIRMYAELLAQDRVKGEEKRAEYFEVIGQETGRLTRLVSNALEFGRLEQGGREIKAEEFDVAAELSTIAETQRMRCEALGLKIVEHDLEQPVVGRADRDVFHHIVLNLIDNVCKYAAEGGELSLGISKADSGAVAVVVGDRGTGIDPGDHDRIFAKFSRLDEALTSEQKGAGLGLSISRDLARRMGGDLHYAARSGGGSEFILSLP
ncbi:MAG: HAMP domain-containing histidine kinase [Opitutaceae bacterium]|nr:HAMP domain-containing histidine kinase [Opitutaceae bacterium]